MTFGSTKNLDGSFRGGGGGGGDGSGRPVGVTTSVLEGKGFGYRGTESGSNSQKSMAWGDTALALKRRVAKALGTRGFIGLQVEKVGNGDDALFLIRKERLIFSDIKFALRKDTITLVSPSVEKPHLTVSGLMLSGCFHSMPEYSFTFNRFASTAHVPKLPGVAEQAYEAMELLAHDMKVNLGFYRIYFDNGTINVPTGFLREVPVA